MYGHHTRHCRAVREDSAVVAVIARSTTGAQFVHFMSLPKLDFSEICFVFHQNLQKIHHFHGSV